MEHNDRGRTTSRRDIPGHGMEGRSGVMISELNSKRITCTHVHACV